MTRGPFSLVLARISSRISRLFRDFVNSLILWVLDSLNICKILFPMLAKGMEKLHI